MAYLIGTDEAGYGPNLGPLVITAAVWKVPDWRVPDDHACDLYKLLRSAVCQSPAAGAPGRGEKIPIADSKLLYKPKQSLQPLETGLLCCLSQRHSLPATWRDGWKLLAGATGAQLDDSPWHAGYDRPLPIASDGDSVARLAERLAATMHAKGVELTAVRSRAIFPRRFNELCGQFGGKGVVLTDQTIGLLAELVEPLDEPCHAVCDKHGGRNRYAGALQHYFPERRLQVECEGRASSRYRLARGERALSINFCTGGEQFLPAALASMASKYLRELAMLAFNDYWLAAVPELRPTAGYPLDAVRFRREIAAVQQGRGIADDCLWRAR